MAKLRYPTDYIGVTKTYSSSHKAIDLGWWGKTSKRPIYSVGAGTIEAIRNNYATNDKTGSSYGNYVKIKHSDGYHSLYAHLVKGSIPVKKGDVVKMGQKIGTMGNTGHSNGPHLHLEIRKNGKLVKPYDHLYAYPEQEISSTNKYSKYVKRYVPLPTPTTRNEEVNQIQVTTTTLRVRSTPSLKGGILGYAKKGFYNSLEIKEADGYTWHRLDVDMWVAQTSTVKYLPKKEEEPIAVIIEDIKEEKEEIVEEKEEVIETVADLKKSMWELIIEFLKLLFKKEG